MSTEPEPTEAEVALWTEQNLRFDGLALLHNAIALLANQQDEGPVSDAPLPLE